jgi:carboxymethylenebutenolidase
VRLSIEAGPQGAPKRADDQKKGNAMGEFITLTAADGHRLPAWQSGKEGPGLVVIQEIFGVNNHIRHTADRFAAEGFTVIAPALFDRVGPGIELGYGEDDVKRGREIRAKVPLDEALRDIAAAVVALKTEGRHVGVVGYCWGGSLAWAAATRLEGIDAAVSYYGGEVAKMADERPRCPVMLHFGEKDHAIPMSDVETVRKKQPGLPVYTYSAGHGFSCDERGSFDPESHALALSRTLPFLRVHLHA